MSANDSQQSQHSQRARNRKTWDAWTQVNYESDFYDVEAFLRDAVPSSRALDELDARLLGDVDGASLLHLQCHFGMDTLTQARRGAQVVGVDFSSEAIARARLLAKRVGLAERSEFIEHDVLELRLDRRFEFVFTSWGVLSWLGDLERWAETVSAHLAPGGRFVLIEGHPFALVFDEQPTLSQQPEQATSPADARYRFKYPYSSPHAMRIESNSVYSSDVAVQSVTYEWQHGLGDILKALLGVGLEVRSLEEYPFCAWQMFPWMTRRPDGLWTLPESDKASLPLSFSVVATQADSA